MSDILKAVQLLCMLSVGLLTALQARYWRSVVMTHPASVLISLLIGRFINLLFRYMVHFYGLSG